MKTTANNQVTIAGEVVSEVKFNHEVYGEGFYTVKLRVSRESGIDDVIPIMISERLMDVTQDYRGRYMAILGEFHSYNYTEGTKRRLQLYVFAVGVEILEELFEMPNSICLNGYICK